MSRTKASISISLDGFAAGPNETPANPLGDGGEQLHEWLAGTAGWRARHGREGGATGPADDLLEEVTSAGASVIGHRMFEAGEPHWGEEPPFGHPVFVLTSRPREPLARGASTFEFVGGPVEEVHARALAEAGGEDVTVNGAHTLRQFVEAGLIDELCVHAVPVFLGGGVRLFDGIAPGDSGLECIDAFTDLGVVHTRYRRTG
jgi:dihydrofolate reductase